MQLLFKNLPSQATLANTQNNTLAKLAIIEQAEQQAIPEEILTQLSHSNANGLLNALRGKYLANKQLVDFGRVNKQDKLAYINIYRNGMAGAGAAQYSSFELPVSADPLSLYLLPGQSKQMVLTFSPYGAPAFYNELKQIGAKFYVKAQAGLFLKFSQATLESIKYNFKTALKDSLNGTEERIALLAEPMVLYKFSLKIKTTDLRQVLAFLKDLEVSSLMLPFGDTFTIDTINSGLINTEFDLIPGQSILVEKAGKDSPEIMHIIAGSGPYTFETDATTPDINLESGLAKVLQPFNLKSIDAVQNDGETCNIDLTLLKV